MNETIKDTKPETVGDVLAEMSRSVEKLVLVPGLKVAGWVGRLERAHASESDSWFSAGDIASAQAQGYRDGAAYERAHAAGAGRVPEGWVILRGGAEITICAPGHDPGSVVLNRESVGTAEKRWLAVSERLLYALADAMLSAAPDPKPAPEAEARVGDDALSKMAASCDWYKRSRDWYKRRCDALQGCQSRMRDPERMMVCDVLANGSLLKPEGGRYSIDAYPAPQPPAEPAAQPAPSDACPVAWAYDTPYGRRYSFADEFAAALFPSAESAPPDARTAMAPTGDGTDAATERAFEQTIAERDRVEAALNKVLDHVLGEDRAEWSSAYDYDDAVGDVEERMAALETGAHGSAQAAQGDVEALNDAAEFLLDLLRFVRMEANKCDSSNDRRYFDEQAESITRVESAIRRLASAQPAAAKPAGDALLAEARAIAERHPSKDARAFAASVASSLTRLTGGSHGDL